MKSLRSIITACIAIFALSPVAFGLPAGKDGAKLPTLTKKSQFEELNDGDKVALVCKMCDTGQGDRRQGHQAGHGTL